ncbi:MAG: ATP-binding protein [Treponema sp.]
MNTPANTIKTIKEIPLFQALDKKNIETAAIHCQKHGTLHVDYYSFLGKPLTCPLCKEEKEAEKKAAEAENKRIEQLKQYGIRDRHFNASFENYKPQNEKAREILETLQAIARHPEQKLILLYGNSGTGKSHLASAAVILNKGIYTTYECMSMKIRASYAYRAKNTEDELMEYYFTLPFLVIDEIEKGKNEDAKKTLISHICRERYERSRPLWLCGNCNCEWIEQMFDSAVIDRMQHEGTSFCFDWESNRPKMRSV